MAHWLRMRQFGKARYFPRPKSEQQWQMLYNEHKSLVPNIARIEVEWGTKGKGQTGARYFKALNLDPLKYWNKELEVSLKRNVGEVAPKVRVQLKDGTLHELDVQSKLNDDILKEVVQLDPNGQIVKNGPGYLAHYD